MLFIIELKRVLMFFKIVQGKILFQIKREKGDSYDNQDNNEN